MDFRGVYKIAPPGPCSIAAMCSRRRRAVGGRWFQPYDIAMDGRRCGPVSGLRARARWRLLGRRRQSSPRPRLPPPKRCLLPSLSWPSRCRFSSTATRCRHGPLSLPPPKTLRRARCATGRRRMGTSRTPPLSSSSNSSSDNKLRRTSRPSTSPSSNHRQRQPQRLPPLPPPQPRPPSPPSPSMRTATTTTTTTTVMIKTTCRRPRSRPSTQRSEPQRPRRPSP